MNTINQTKEHFITHFKDHNNKIERVIFAGIVGSYVYGMETPDSDIDVGGIWLIKSEEVLKLYPPKKLTYNGNVENVDYELHELSKFLQLLLKNNPTILTLLGVPSDLIIKDSEIYWEIRNNSRSFLDKEKIFNGFRGYAQNEFNKIANKMENNEKYIIKMKHAAHIIRLLSSGIEILKTGNLNPIAPHLEIIRKIKNGEMEWKEILEMKTKLEEEIIKAYEQSILQQTSEIINWTDKFLIKTRMRYLR